MLNEEEINVISNTLKVLFNCTISLVPEGSMSTENIDEELMSNLSELCQILHLLLTLDKECFELNTIITRDVTNLLTNFTIRPCTDALLLPLDKELIASAEMKEVEYDGACMNAPKEILDFLLETVDKVGTRST